MYICKKLLLPLLLGGCSCLFAQNIQNPVLPGVADAGVINYNGKYYIGGVSTNGNFYVSDDLVHWGNPVHVVSMDNGWTKGSGAGDDQIHADDMLYLNGDFHLYWSVNYWGKDKHAVHIVHAQSKDILGPYTEPEKRTWMDNRIDPNVFKDDDGQLYMYMVRFTDGNTIWARKMENPAQFSGEPICLFASLPDTWETMDNRVAEGPWVMKYRDCYYMMYNANHTSTLWGNYQLGVAEADSPLGFQNGNKYSYPVLLSNQTDLEENYVDILRYNKSYEPMFAYRESVPQSDWTKADYDASDWKRGTTGFASEELKGSTTRHFGTLWTTPSLWLRKSFVADEKVGNLALRVAHDGDTKIYLNGVPIYNKQGADYCIVNLDKEKRAVLRNGFNVLAVETHKGKNNFFDVSLFDMKDTFADDILMTPGQPNILRGPNGFEWWLIYMANKNHERRGQYINRVQFFDKTLSVDGITSHRTIGYHPEPSKPTYGDVFDKDGFINSAWQWDDDSLWKVKNGELIKTGIEKSYGVLKKIQLATAYLFEAGIKTNGEAGVIAWWKDHDNYVYVGLDASSNSWYLRTHIGADDSKKSYLLPFGFRWDVYHTFRIERNMDCLKVSLDGIPSPRKSYFEAIIPTSIPGVPGVFAQTPESSFDGIVYTIGFDDYGIKMPLWEVKEGNCENTVNGLKVLSDRFEAFKGDLLDNYEYSFQISGLSDNGWAGGYPVYIDANNYVKASFSGIKRMLEVTLVGKGKQIWKKDFSLSCLQTLYPDVKYTDFIEKGYRLATPTWVDALYLNRHEVGDKLGFVDNMFDKFGVEYLYKGEWHSLDTTRTEIAKHPAYNCSSFTPLKMEGFRIINKNPEDLQQHIYKIRIHELLKESYNLRTVRCGNMLHLFVDGKEICFLDINLPASRIGLCSENCYPVYNGMLFYHTGK
ncbi:family 43 glycosylhydrolase [uncultured Bacteroides sp.]|uniref:family 43 glycosylhydrolase n=1 Tax=uncultured Bacteroides sp. TaxID=162156 RepID=UPI002AA94F4E|nr:family 43 glycosylhydrolase [uncultured Bacteroides sp.]